MTQSHTPGPWKATKPVKQTGDGPNFLVYVLQANVTGLVPAVCPAITTEECIEQEANAARIVSCVNACEGINPEAVPDLLHQLQMAVVRVELANREGDPILSAWLPGARAAIAKATYEKEQVKP